MNSQKVVFCFQTMTRINSAGTAEPDRRGKPVAGGEWNPLPRDHGQIASPTFLLNKHHPHCHNHPVTWIQIINNLLTIIIIVIITKLKLQFSNSQVIVLHREYTQGGSIGVTLAGGADYESKEITVTNISFSSTNYIYYII